MLDGGVGLIALREFPPPNPDTVEVVAGAMQQVADAKALIFDLRANRGGHPETVALWCSYLLGPAPVDLITVLDRDGAVLWEGTGVTPDVDVPADEALEAAIEAAGE